MASLVTCRGRRRIGKSTLIEEISLPQGVFRKTKVYALAPDGTRRDEIPIRRLPYSYGFTADVARDQKSATYLYEIVHE